MNAVKSSLRDSSVGLALLIMTLAVYWPVRHYEFINYDDPAYVTENSHVLGGFSHEGIVWAFGQLTGKDTYWHPVTWLSHMLDCQLFGTNAGAHHLVNVCFHATNAVLLFLLLKNLTGARGRSAVLAALFALHPLQVDSVAWVTERKNLLSTFFFILTLWAYSRYAAGKAESRKPKMESGPPPSALRPLTSGFYWLALLLFALGLMSKPMLVTVPFVLLLLDYWPLLRFQRSTLNSHPSTLLRLLWEKLPFLALSAASATITIFGHQQLASLLIADRLPLLARLANALVSYVRYLGKMIWPVDLAVFYPYPNSWSLLVVVGAILLLAGVTVGVIWLARRQPYLAMGWFWFLGTLVPVIGLVQAGSQAMADRFTYVPLIGLFVVLVWGGSELFVRWRLSRTAIGSIATVILVACALRSADQLRHWRNDETLFSHALQVTERNFLAYNVFGGVLQRQGKLDQAFACYAEALRLVPDYSEAHYNLATVLRLKGKRDEAITHFKESLRLQPGFALAHNGLGRILLDGGKIDEALAHLKQALQINPDYADAHNNLGIAFIRQGQTAEAVMQFEACLQLNPNDPDAHYNLGNVAFAQGRFGDAVNRYRTALRVRPDYFRAHHNLGMALAELGQMDEAMAEYAAALKLQSHFAPTQYQLADVLLKQGKREEATRWFAAAAESQPDFAEAHYRLGLILAEAGNLGEAIQHFREAVRLKPDWAEALNDLAWVLATSKEDKLRNGTEAVRLATRAAELTGNRDSRRLRTLAAAYAEAGQFGDAVKTLQRAIELAASAGSKELIPEYHRQLELYQSGKPYSP